MLMLWFEFNFVNWRQHFQSFFVIMIDFYAFDDWFEAFALEKYFLYSYFFQDNNIRRSECIVKPVFILSSQV